MKKVLLAIIALACMGYGYAQAQLVGNLGLTTDYRFRGISQTQNAPAVQGGVDYSHASGFYAGNWNSSVSSLAYTNGAGVENDVYAGYKTKVLGLELDVGSMNYFYPRATNNTSTNFDTNEIYVSVGRGPVTAKISNSLSNYFGAADSKNSRYYQLDAVQPVVGKLAAVVHVGRADVANNSGLNYTDWNVGAVYNLGGWDVAGKFYSNSNQGSSFNTTNTVNGQQLYRDTVVVSVSKSFN